MRIVVVDDDRGVRESLRRSLELNGYTVELAEDGQKAMDAVTRQRPDAMVLDMMMPRLNGLEVCRRLRSAGDDLPVLLLTARDAVSDRVAGLDAGADDYLPKPFILEELLARLRALLRRSTFDRPGNPGAAVGDVKSVTPSHPVKRHVCLKTRLTTKIIGAASVIVAAIGLIPPFAGAFWASNAPDSKVSHSNDASCFIIRSISDVNGIPQAIAFMNFQVETHARGQEYTYLLLVTLMLTDGSLRTEETQIEETPAVVIFPLDLLSRDSKRHNLMVDVDSARVSDVPMGACL